MKKIPPKIAIFGGIFKKRFFFWGFDVGYFSLQTDKIHLLANTSIYFFLDIQKRNCAKECMQLCISLYF